MKKIIIIKLLVFTSLFTSCDNKKQSENSDNAEQSTHADIGSSYDGLITAYKFEIEKHYDNYREQNRGESYPELELEGEVSYEDENYLIISFNEILKYGSWHYSSSSFVFKKLGGQKFEAVLPDRADTITGPNWDRELAYESRINGAPFYVDDLNGDQLQDIIFKSTTSVRSTVYSQYSFYTFEDGALKKAHLTIGAEMDDGYGIEDTIIIDRQETPPVIIVQSREIKCDTETGVKLSIPSSDRLLYQWNENEFIGAEKIHDRIRTDIDSVNDSIGALRTLGVVNKDMRASLFEALNKASDKEKAFFSERIKINEKYGGIYDSLVLQVEQKVDKLRRLETLRSPNHFSTLKTENTVQIVD